MKKSLCLLTSLVFSFMFFACTESDSEIDDTLQTVHISLEKEQSAFRTVYPSSWTYGGSSSEASKLYYTISAYTIDTLGAVTTDETSTLWYTDSENKDQRFSVVSYADLVSSAGISITLDPAIWRITLSAYKTAVSAIGSGNNKGQIANTDCVLTATKEINLSSKNKLKNLSFNLLAVETGVTGTLAVDLTFFPPDTFNQLSYALYSYAGNGAIGSAVSGFSHSYLKSAVEFTKETTDVTGFSTEYALIDEISLDVPAGHYWFILTFYDKNGNRMTRYPLSAVIEGSNTTYSDIVLQKSVFNSAPRNCSNIAVSYTYGSKSIEKEMSLNAKVGRSLYELQTTASAATAVFDVTITWADNADNEDSYKMQMSTDGGAWADVSAVLPAGTTSYNTTLATGHRYTVRIKPVNMYSVNDYAGADGFDSFVESEQFGIFTVAYAAADTNGVAGTIKVTNSVETSGDYVVIPYIYNDNSYNDLLSSSASGHPYVVLPTGAVSVSWSDGADTITTLEGNSGNKVLTPVWGN